MRYHEFWLLSYRRCIVRNHDLKLEKRVFILQCYIATKGTFQCSTWSDLKPGALKRFHACVMDLYRDVSGHYSKKPLGKDLISDEDLLFQYNLISPESLLRMARTLLFGRIVVKAPSVLLDLIKDMATLDKGWTATLIRDLQWLAISPDFSECLNFSYVQWVEHIRGNPKRYKRLIHKFIRLRIANVPTVCTKGKPKLSVECSFTCSMCSNMFASFQRLCLHQFKAHGTKNVWRLYVP